jgi:hypothetical protein
VDAGFRRHDGRGGLGRKDDVCCFGSLDQEGKSCALLRCLI